MAAILCAGLAGCSSGPKVSKAQRATLAEFDKRTAMFGEPDWVGYAVTDGSKVIERPVGIRNELAGKGVGPVDGSPHVPFEAVKNYTFYYPTLKQQVVFEGSGAAREVMDDATQAMIADVEKKTAEAEAYLRKVIGSVNKPK